MFFAILATGKSHSTLSTRSQEERVSLIGWLRCPHLICCKQAKQEAQGNEQSLFLKILLSLAPVKSFCKWPFHKSKILNNKTSQHLTACCMNKAKRHRSVSSEGDHQQEKNQKPSVSLFCKNIQKACHFDTPFKVK